MDEYKKARLGLTKGQVPQHGSDRMRIWKEV